VADWRRIYEPVYRHIRDHLAHNKKGVSDLDALLAMTNIEEMKRMLGFFHALHEGLVELYLKAVIRFRCRTSSSSCRRSPSRSGSITPA
jgi:hypothetical protein